MMFKSNINIFFILLLTLLFPASCSKEKNDVIPDVYVDFYISLNDPQFFDLTAPLNYAYVDASTNNIGERAAGYDGNGIIIFRAQENEFFAYDRTCPHDYFVNGMSIKVSVIDGIYAVCPECSSKYALPNYGTPLSGYVSKYPLKNYRTSFDGLNVHVWNY
jgi:nitrite reductase/ring-hydroxylating ferredoxin subunit